MQNTNFKGKLSTVSALCALTLSLSMSLSATAGTVEFKDPMPAGPTYPGCLDDLGGTPTGADGGISYDWTVKMGKKDSATLINFVGAKSLNEPTTPETGNTYVPPEVGWTHTANWVALEITEPTKLKLKVSRIEGVPFVQLGLNDQFLSKGYSRDKLIPGIAVYSGIDNTSCEDHRFNPNGNVDWSPLEWMGNNLNTAQRGSVEYEIPLMPGQYSIAIGGAPKTLATYPANNCNPVDKTCYTYTGRHGYKVEMKTGF